MTEFRSSKGGRQTGAGVSKAGRLRRRTAWFLSVAVAAAATWSPAGAVLINVQQPALAQGVDFGAVFTARDKSLYHAGPKDGFSQSGRIGTDPISQHDTVGNVHEVCAGPVCGDFGAEVGGRVDANFGLSYGATVSGGSFDAVYPINAYVITPSKAPIANNNVTVLTGYSVAGFDGTPVGGFTAATLTTHSPNAEAYVDLDAHFDAFVGAQACFGVCDGPAIRPPVVDVTETIASVNLGGYRTAVLGPASGSLNTQFSSPDHTINGLLNLPDLDSKSGIAGSSRTDLVAQARDTLAAISANVGAIVSQTIGIPLSGTIAGIGYDLLDISAGIALAIKQVVSLVITPRITFDFMTPVIDALTGKSTTQITANLGDDVSFRSNAAFVGVTPTLSLMATLTNTTSLVVQGDVNLKALAANIYGFDVGPLYKSGDQTADLFDIDLFKNSFDVDFNKVIGPSFNVQQSRSDSVPLDSGYRLALAAGDPDPDDPTLTNTVIVAQDGACAFTRLCPYSVVGAGSPVRIGEDGSLAFLAQGDTLTAPVGRQGAQGTDADQLALLIGAGFRPGPVADLAPPTGTALPEPGAWMLMLTGFGLMGGALRRRRVGAAAEPS